MACPEGQYWFCPRSILHETILKRKMSKNNCIVQLSPECVFVETLDPPQSNHTVKSGLRIKGLDIYGRHFCVWDGKKIEVYEVPRPNGLPTSPITPTRSFPDLAPPPPREGGLESAKFGMAKFGTMKLCHGV